MAMESWLGPKIEFDKYKHLFVSDVSADYSTKSMSELGVQLKLKVHLLKT